MNKQEAMITAIVAVLFAVGLFVQPLGFIGGLVTYHLLRRWNVIK